MIQVNPALLRGGQMSLLRDLIRGPAPRQADTDTLAKADTGTPAEPPFVSEVSTLSVSTSPRSRETGARWDAADWQTYYDERAGIAEFDSGLPRPDAEGVGAVAASYGLA
jgi:hypothetical protein